MPYKNPLLKESTMDNQLSYSLHLGSDKNRTAKAKENAKKNLSGTTSKSNNSIQNSNRLGHALTHDLRLNESYDNEGIVTLIGEGNSKDEALSYFKNYFNNIFEEARIEYNNKQSKPSRRIEDYYKKISEDKERDLACELILEIGDMKYWNKKDSNFKYKMVNVFQKQLNDLEEIMPQFKIGIATVHLDEKSPHMHVIGIPTSNNFKNGMSLQVAKSKLFTRESLRELQDKMRIKCIEEFNNEYNLNYTLVDKKPGRNYNIPVKYMNNYDDFQKYFNKNYDKINSIQNNAYGLNNKSNNMNITLNKIMRRTLTNDSFEVTRDELKELFEYNKYVYNSSHNIQNAGNLTKMMDNYKATIDKFYMIIDTFNGAYKVSSKSKNGVLDNINDTVEEIASAINEWLKVIELLTYMVLTKQDPKYKDLVNDLIKNNIISQKEYNHIMYGTSLKSKNIERNDINEQYK